MGQMRFLRKQPANKVDVAVWQGYYVVENLTSLAFNRTLLITAEDHKFARNNDFLSDMQALQSTLTDLKTMWDPQPLYGSVYICTYDINQAAESC